MIIPVKGQRWMSSAEPELGLAIILEVDRRQVRLYFRGSDETRIYSLESAPIERVVFKPGERVQSKEGQTLVIEAVREEEGVLFYQQGETEIGEFDLADSNDLATAERRLIDGRVDSGEVFRLRAAVWEHRKRLQGSLAHGYLGARMDLIPHQLYLAQRVAERPRPRALLADEVGLGKTIEACLILHRLHVRGRSGRVLILVPEALTHQWFVELYRRFNLTCSIYNEERCLAMERSENPFLESHLILAQVEWLAGNPERRNQVLAADWGLVLVDEAHHLKGTVEAPSPEYALVAALGELSPGLLLLTGTPEQFGVEAHFARLRLLDPERFVDLPAFEAESARYREVAGLLAPLLEGKGLAKKVLRGLQEFLVRQGGDTELEERLVALSEERPADLEHWLDDFLDRYGMGRIVARNTRAAIAGFPKRKMHPAALTLPAEMRELRDEIEAEVGFELGLVETLPKRKWEKDPRVTWLVKLLKRYPDEKFLVICRYQKRAEGLAEAIRTQLNVGMTVFHEEQTLMQRDRNAAWFSQPAPDGARLLICSEIGSEGRNFQFAHHLVLFDLPVDPELLEQRIGRLDRIGQREVIHLHVPYFKGTSGEWLFRWFHEGIDAFLHPVRGGALFLERFLPRFKEALGDSKQISELIDETAQFRRELEKRFESGRDRLMEWQSCRRERVAPLIEEIGAFDRETVLADFMLQAFDHLGVQVEKLGMREGPGGESGRSWLLTPGPMMTDQLHGIPVEGRMITFDRKVALDRDDLDFMTWDHPLVTSVMDVLLVTGAGNAAFSEAERSDELSPGIWVEMIYVLETTGATSLDAGRFLPPTALRVVVGTSGEILEGNPFDGPLKDAPIHVLQGKATELKLMIDGAKERGEEEAEKRALLLRREALQVMNSTMDRELDRLRVLGRRQGRVAMKDIEILDAEKASLIEAIGGSRLRMDAVRLVRVR
jgi:ATP-dependent helicase HepA